MENREVRLIDANALLQHIKDVPTWSHQVWTGYTPRKYPQGMYDPDDVVSSIENAPTIGLGDLWPHAKWTKDHTCTSCGEFALEAPEAHCYYHTIYCPHCGAFMDKED